MQPMDPMLLYGILSYLAQNPAMGDLGSLAQYQTPSVMNALSQIRGIMPSSWLPQLRAQFVNSPYGPMFGDQSIRMGY